MLSAAQTDGKVLAIWREPFKLGSPTVEAWTPGLNVQQIVDRMHCLPADFRENGSVQINGVEVPREFWGVARPRATSIRKPVAMTFHVAVQGGGGRGGGGFKQVLALVAALALTLVTAGIGSGLAVPLLGASFAAGTIGATLLAAGVSLVGALIVGALTSTPSQSASATDTTASGGGTSVEAGAVNGNSLEPNAAIPRVIGERRIFPAFLFEPVTEIIGQNEIVDAVYGLAGPHRLRDIRLGDAAVSTDENDADILIQTFDGRQSSTPITYPQRYGRTFPLNVEMSVHGTDPVNLQLFASPLPVFHAMSMADSPDEAWMHILMTGLIMQSDITKSLRIPFRIRMRLRGTSAWRYLPEVMYMDKTQSQRRIQFKFRFGESFVGILPTPPSVRGFIDARKKVPAQTASPIGVDWFSDPYFEAASGNDLYSLATVATTRVQNMSLEADTCTFYLDDTWASGIYDVEIKRGATIRDDLFTASTYAYSGVVYDLYGSTSSGLLPLSRDGLLDRVALTRMVSIKRVPPVNTGNLALIYLQVRNRSVQNLSVRAAGYVADYVNSHTWTIRTSAANNDWYAIIWSPELALFVAVGITGTGNRVMTSPDGITWTIRTSAADNIWRDIAWSPSLGLFVAIADTGTGNRVMTSPNGIAWTIRTSAADNNWLGVCWSPELALFVAVAYSGTGNRVMTSPNGIVWTLRTSAADLSWTNVCWSPELALFVAVSYNGGANDVMTSPNGIAWTLRAGAADLGWRAICWSPELAIFLAVADTGSGNRVMTSPDGITWTSQISAADNGWQDVCWSHYSQQFIAVANTGTGNRVMTSFDGIEWTTRPSAADNNWRAIADAPEIDMVAAVATSGTGNRVMSSSSEWGDVRVSSNPAPHYRDVLSGILNFDPLPDELHDNASLIEWRNVCIDNDYTCDLITEGATVDELLRIVASTGFARPYQSEIWGIIRDYDRSAESPVTTLSNRNTNSFKWRKAFPRLPAGLRVNFKDEDFEYSGKQIVVYRNGASESDARTEQISYVGIVNRGKIIDRATFDLRQAEFRPTIYTLNAPIESIVCRRGSLVALNHDVLDNHQQAARIDTVIVNGGGDVTGVILDCTITVKNAVDILSTTDILAVVDILEVGLKTAVAIRRTNGVTTVHQISNAAGETDTLTFTTPITNPAGPTSIYDSGSIKQIHTGCLLVAGILDNEYKRMLVSDVAPGKDLTATLTLVDEAPELWS